MIILFIIAIIISTMLHELAHFVIAKKVGCKVEEVSLGFGKTLIQFKYRKIIYKIKLLLFGGDCQLKGERKYIPVDKDAFCNLSYRKKVYIGIAGCMVNLLLGILCLLLSVIFGRYYLWYFGILNIILGITNLLPIAPCLDGGYLIWIPIYFKIWGSKIGMIKFIKASKISFIIIILINILSLPYLIYLIINKIL